MKISLDWLNEFIDIPCTPEELGEKLTYIGLETEKIEKVGDPCEGVIVGKILDIQKHPDADKLTVCQVDIGKEKLQIVCGAKNMQVNDLVPVATVGTTLPNGLKIKKAKLRGVESSGMMCSSAELKLAKESEGLLILPSDFSIGKPINEVLPLQDTLLEINITPNRADCLSHLGIARELSVLFNQPIQLPKIKLNEIKEKVPAKVKVKISSTSCQRYTARLIQEVKVAPSPLWMQLRLERCGVRPVNNLVDITSYVMLEVGQPLHAFDFNQLKGKTIFVRDAKDKEKITTLDDKKRTLSKEDLLIADEKGGIALAGVMGGKESEVSEKTSMVLLESAYFSPQVVRSMSKKCALQSESSYRFERGVDISNVDWASQRAASLIEDYAQGKVFAGVIDEGKKEPPKKKISLRIAQIDKILGISIPLKTTERILKQLNLKVVSKNDKKLEVQIPTYRHDLTREIDLIEEIIRFYGYDKIVLSQPKTNVITHELTPIQAIRKKGIDYLIGLGFYQTINYSFVGEKDLAPLCEENKDWLKQMLILKNPVSEETKMMRPRILPSLLKVASHNQARGNQEIRIFEIASTYEALDKEKKKILEKDSLAFLLSQPAPKMHWQQNHSEVDFYDIKGITEQLIHKLGVRIDWQLEKSDHKAYHPGQSGCLTFKNKPFAHFGQLHPLLLEAFDLEGIYFAAEISLDKLEKLKPKTQKFKPFSRFPKVTRDIALLVDETVQEQAIRTVIDSAQSHLLENFVLFDVYSGPQVPKGQKSLAYSLHYRNQDGTLTDSQVTQEHQRICQLLQDKLKCHFRI